MIHKTRGIVLGFIKYRETSIIARIYTEAFGMQSYIVNSVRTGQKKSKSKISFFQPLTLLELVVYHKKNSGLNRISDIKCTDLYTTLPYDFKKSAIALFVAEVLNKSLREEESNTSLFDFLYSSLQMFDHMAVGYENFHLQLMLKLSRYLGFAPQSAEAFFDHLHDMTGKADISTAELNLVNHWLNQPYTEVMKSKQETRRMLLSDIIKLYQWHVEGFGELKSLSVLREVVE